MRPLSRDVEPARPLAWVRIGIGSVATLKACHLATLLPSLTAPGSIRVPWVAGFRPGGELLWAMAIALAGAGVLLALGWRSRTSAAATGVLATAWLLSDRQLYANHLYLLALIAALLSASDCGAALSLDSRHRERRLVAALPVDLLRLQLSIVYGFAAIAKINPSYLSGEALRSFVSDPAISELPIALLQGASVASIVGEAFVAIGLWVPATRRWAALLGVGLHVGMIALIDYPLPLLLFAAEMLLLYPLFFSGPAAAEVEAPPSLDYAATG